MKVACTLFEVKLVKKNQTYECEVMRRKSMKCTCTTESGLLIQVPRKLLERYLAKLPLENRLVKSKIIFMVKIS